MASIMPCSTGLMYSAGTTPPRIELTEFKALAFFVLAEAQPDVTVLTTTTALADKFTLDFNAALADCLAVGDLRLTDVGFDRKLALHAID